VLELGKDLERLFTNEDGTAKPEARKALEDGVREFLSEEMGMTFPAVSLRIENPHLRPTDYAIVLFDAPIARGSISPGQALALADMESATSRGLTPTAMKIPWSRAVGVAIPADQIRKATEAGFRVLPADKVILNHVMVALRRNAAEFLGIQEVSNLVERLKLERPDLIKAVIPTHLTLQQVTEVLKVLLRERTPIRDLRLILESLAKHGQAQKHPGPLAELVRKDLRRQLCARYTAGRPVLPYYALDPEIERMIQDATVDTVNGPEVALAYADHKRIIDALDRTIDARRHLTTDPIVMATIPGVRRHLRSAFEVAFPDAVFLSFSELAPEVIPSQIGIITLGDGEN